MAILDGIPEPQLGDIEKKEQSDMEYNTPLTIPLDKQKEELKESLYGKTNDIPNIDAKKENIVEGGTDFGAPGISEEEGPNIEFVNENFIEDSEYFPILKNLHESNYIDNETFNNLELTKEGGLNEFLKVINSIPNESIKNNILKSFDNKEKIREETFDKTEFNKDSSLLNIDLDKGIGGLEIMLAENYISIPNIDGNENKENDLSTCMDATLNKLLINSSIEFKEQNGDLIYEIRGENNLDKKYSLLKDLYKEDLKRDAILGGKKGKEEVKMKKKSLINEAIKLEKQIQASLINNNTEEFKKLDIQKDIIISEVQELVKGDVFEAGELDIVMGEVKEGKEQA